MPVYSGALMTGSSHKTERSISILEHTALEVKTERSTSQPIPTDLPTRHGVG